ncbi:MAG: hypothetical protein ACLFS9_11435, partial [Nitriliruptoraceae bacterium]
MRRALLWVVLPVSVLLVVGLGVGGWYYSDQLLPAPPPWEPVADLTVTEVDPDAGTLTVATTVGDVLLPRIGFVSDDG